MATKNYKEISKEARLKVLEMIHKAGTSHIASNFSVIDIATVVYENLKPEDVVVWSKGWASASIYYFLSKQGKIPKEDLEIFGKEIDGKVKYMSLAETNIPGVLCNGGSMGHGLPIACGIALAKKLKREEGRVFCIMSDGEMNEGTTWESAAFARHNLLNNLMVVVDKNNWQAMGRTYDVLHLNLVDIFSGFKWEIAHVDGHDFNELEVSISDNIWFDNFPKVVIAETVKGKGVSFFENHLLYHYKHVDKDEYEKAVLEIKGND